MNPVILNIVKNIISILAILFIVLNTIPLTLGLSQSEEKDSDCKKEMKRIEYVVPGYRIGCWLGERVTRTN